MRPDIDDYIAKGYVPLTEQYDNSVSHALEYYIADYALSRFAQALGKKEDAKLFYDRSLGYKHSTARSSVHYVPFYPTEHSTLHSIRWKEPILLRVPVSMRGTPGIIHFMFPMILQA